MAEPGVKELIVGVPVTRKVKPAIEALPAGVLTRTLPVAPDPTTATSVVAFNTVNDAAGTSPKCTEDAPERWLPLINTERPRIAELGEKDDMEGAWLDTNAKPVREAVPPGVVTDTAPLAPAPTMAVMVVALCTLKDVAATPPKRTLLAPLKLLPCRVTVCPLWAESGVKEWIIGGGVLIKVNPFKEAVPPGVVTDTAPLAPVPTTASKVVAFTTTKEAAAVPPKRTLLAPLRLLPLMRTVAPARASAGENELMPGALAPKKVNPPRDAVPPGVVTDTAPEAPLPIVAMIVSASMTEKEAALLPPKRTAVAFVKCVPLRSTALPVDAEAGVKDNRVGPLGMLENTHC